MYFIQRLAQTAVSFDVALYWKMFYIRGLTPKKTQYFIYEYIRINNVYSVNVFSSFFAWSFNYIFLFHSSLLIHSMLLIRGRSRVSAHVCYLRYVSLNYFILIYNRLYYISWFKTLILNLDFTYFTHSEVQ